LFEIRRTCSHSKQPPHGVRASSGDRAPNPGFYDVKWITDGKVSARGVGLEVENGKGLAVGWRRVAD
jgi:hypothetical protein